MRNKTDIIHITQQEYEMVRKSLQEAPHTNEKLEMIGLLIRITSRSNVKIENLPSPAFEEAIKWYDILFAICSNGGVDEQMLANEYTDKGFCCYSLKRYEEAAESYKMSVKMNSKNYVPYVQLATLYFCGHVGIIDGNPDWATSLMYAEKGISLMTEEERREEADFIGVIGDIYCTQEKVKNIEAGRRYLDEAVSWGDDDAAQVRKEIFGY